MNERQVTDTTRDQGFNPSNCDDAGLVEGNKPGLDRTIGFLRSHRRIARIYLFSVLVWMVAGGVFVLGIGWQLAWPWSDLPFFGSLFFRASGGQITPDFFQLMIAAHAVIAILFVAIPLTYGVIGNLVLPLMVGAQEFAYPKLTSIGFCLTWIAFGCVLLSVWLSATGWGASIEYFGSGDVVIDRQRARICWIFGLMLAAVCQLLWCVNCLVTVVFHRADGMSWLRLPVTVWGYFVASVFGLFCIPVLIGCLCFPLLDSGFGVDVAVLRGGAEVAPGGAAWLGKLFNGYQVSWPGFHPATYFLMLPILGILGDVLSCSARQSLFGYRLFLFGVLSLSFLGLLVWVQQVIFPGWEASRYQGSQWLELALVVCGTLISILLLGTLRVGRIRVSPSLLWGLSSLLLFLSATACGLVLVIQEMQGQPMEGMFHLCSQHLFLGSVVCGLFGGVHYWYPKLIGRRLSERLAWIHFVMTFFLLCGAFLPWFLMLGRGLVPGNADPYWTEIGREVQPIQQFMTQCAVGLGIAQLVWFGNVMGSRIWGAVASENPWRANSLDWAASNSFSHGNFMFPPVVYRGPYEYEYPLNSGASGELEDFRPQWVSDHSEESE